MKPFPAILLALAIPVIGTTLDLVWGARVELSFYCGAIGYLIFNQIDW